MQDHADSDVMGKFFGLLISVFLLLASPLTFPLAGLLFLVADTRLYTLPSRSVRPSVPFLNSERFSHYCSCPTERDWIAVYPALFSLFLSFFCFGCFLTAFPLTFLNFSFFPYLSASFLPTFCPSFCHVGSACMMQRLDSLRGFLLLNQMKRFCSSVYLHLCLCLFLCLSVCT